MLGGVAVQTLHAESVMGNAQQVLAVLALLGQLDALEFGNEKG